MSLKDHTFKIESFSPHNASLILKAYGLAKDTLRRRYTSHGIQAGCRQFSDIWIRDSFFASFGSLSLGDQDIVRQNIETCITFISSTGQIPLRVGQKYLALKYLGINDNKLNCRYTEDRGISKPTDGNSLLLIIADQYLSQTKNTQFISKHYESLKKCADWNFTQAPDNDLLIDQGPYASWTDSLKKNGKVLYTNVLHYRAVKAISSISKVLGKNKEYHHYEQLAKKLKKTINTIFWNGEYYDDWVSHKNHRYFSSDGNCLAILFGIASSEQALKIQKSMTQYGINDGFCTLTNYPKYEGKHVSNFFKVIQLGDYHNGLQWLWVGCIDAASKYAMGMTSEAIELLSNIAEKINEFDAVFEVYHNGKPVNRLTYRSESDFSWSSGLFIWACHQLELI